MTAAWLQSDRDIEIHKASLGAEQVFALNQWTWSDSGSPYILTVEQIAACYARLLNDLIVEKQWSIGTGRLLVQRDDLHGYSFLIRLGDVSTDEDSE